MIGGVSGSASALAVDSEVGEHLQVPLAIPLHPFVVPAAGPYDVKIVVGQETQILTVWFRTQPT